MRVPYSKKRVKVWEVKQKIYKKDRKCLQKKSRSLRLISAVKIQVITREAMSDSFSAGNVLSCSSAMIVLV
jgi:hypothetical protein